MECYTVKTRSILQKVLAKGGLAGADLRRWSMPQICEWEIVVGMTWAFQVESSQLHYTYLPAGKSCWFESMIPNVLIHNKSCSSYFYQYHVKLQSWHVSQSISDHADGDVAVARDTTKHAAREFCWI